MGLGGRIWRTAALTAIGFSCTLAGNERANGQLHWPGSSQKEHFQIRVVGRVLALPRTSFFANHEVFVAEKALNREEGRLIKVVYEFLPYQPSLAEIGMNYQTVYEIHATRDPQCDETLGALMSADHAKRSDPSESSGFKYAADAPALTVHHPKASLPCYQTSADDFGQPIHAPVHTAPVEPMPTLK